MFQDVYSIEIIITITVKTTKTWDILLCFDKTPSLANSTVNFPKWLEEIRLALLFCKYTVY